MDFFQERILESLLFLSPEDLPDPGIEPASLILASRFLTTKPPGKPRSDENDTITSLLSSMSFTKPFDFIIAMNWMFESPNIHMLKVLSLMWKYLALGNNYIQRKLWERCPHGETSPLLGRGRPQCALSPLPLSCLLLVSIQQEDDCLQARGRDLTRHLELGLPSFRTMRNKHLLFNPLSLWYLVRTTWAD